MGSEVMPRRSSKCNGDVHVKMDVWSNKERKLCKRNSGIASIEKMVEEGD